MKKIISLALVLMMLLCASAALIPTASAANAVSRAPRFYGYSSDAASNGAFTLHLVAAIDDLKAHDEVGFEITMTRVENGEQVKSNTVIKKCNYAYTSIGGVSASTMGGKYVIALDVTGVPETTSIRYEIKPFSTKSNETEYGTVKTFSLNKSGWQTEVPAFSTSNTSKVTVQATRAFADGTYQIAAVASSDYTDVRSYLKTDFTNYENKLKAAGYELYDTNTIGSNEYRTYKGLTSMVHVYYDHNYRTYETKIGSVVLGTTEHAVVQVIYSPIEKMDYAKVAAEEGTQVAKPSLTFMSLDYTGEKQGANGMGFIYTLKDGSYVILDGGWGYDTETFYNWLKSNNQRDDGIVIRAWLITHPHEDHYGNFESFANKYASQVTLEYFVANLGGGDDTTAPTDTQRIHTALAKFTAVQNTKYIVPQIGQTMYFGQVKFEFLHAQSHLYPSLTVGNGNNHSLVAKVTFEGETMLMMGDAYPAQINLEAYGSYLTADYVQTPHHGYGGTNNSFYDKVGAKFAFITTSQAAFEERMVSTVEADFGALQYLVNTLQTPYRVADNGYYTISYGDFVPAKKLTVGTYGVDMDTIIFGDYFKK